MFRLRLVGFGDRGPANGEQWRGGLWGRCAHSGCWGLTSNWEHPKGSCLCIPESAGNSVWGGSEEGVRAGTARGWGHWGVLLAD